MLCLVQDGLSHIISYFTSEEISLTRDPHQISQWYLTTNQVLSHSLKFGASLPPREESESRGTDQGPVIQTLAQQDESGPTGRLRTNQGPAGQILVSQDESGPGGLF